MDSLEPRYIAKYGLHALAATTRLTAINSTCPLLEETTWLNIPNSSLHSIKMIPWSLQFEVFIAACIGVTSHLAYFKYGDHHMQAPRIFWLHILSFFLVYVLRILINGYPGQLFDTVAICSSYTAALLSSIVTYRLCFHRLRKFPGPVLAGTTKLWHMTQCFDSKNHTVLDNLHRRYGDFVRTGPSELTIFSPEVHWAVGGPDTQCVKSVWYDMLLPLKAVNTVRTKQEHDQRRRGWNLAMTPTAMKSYEKRIHEHALSLDRRIKSTAGKPVEITKNLAFLAFNIMADFAFAKNFSSSQHKEWHDVVHLLRRVFVLVGLLSPVPWLAQLAFSMPIIPIVRDWKRMMNWATNRIDEQIASETELDQANVASWLIHYSKSSKLLKDDVNLLRGESVALVVAGSDTVASTMTYLLYRMALHPEHAAKVRDEISTLSSLDDFDGLKSLNHFNACIRETLRLHPPVPTGGYRDTPPEGIFVAGTYIPGNVTVVTPRYTISRLKRSFERATEFIPERWYSRKEMVINKKSFSPFNIGRYNCAGKNMALAEIRSISAMIISKYELTFAPGTDPDAVWRDMKDQFTVAPGQLSLIFTPIHKSTNFALDLETRNED